VSDGLTIWFGCAAESQKAQNIAYNNKVSLTVTLPYFSWEGIRGLSMGGTAKPVTDLNEINRVSELMLRKFRKSCNTRWPVKKISSWSGSPPRSFPFSITSRDSGTPTLSRSDGVLEIVTFKTSEKRPAPLARPS
jgi:hypothetical protein